MTTGVPDVEGGGRRRRRAAVQRADPVDVVRIQALLVEARAVHDRQHPLTFVVGMPEAQDVAELVQRHAPEVVEHGAAARVPQRSTERVPFDTAVEDDVAFDAGRPAHPGRGHGHGIVERHAVDAAREEHAVALVAVALRNRRIADDLELAPVEHRVPFGERTLGRFGPVARAVHERAARAELEVHRDGPGGPPRRVLEEDEAPRRGACRQDEACHEQRSAARARHRAATFPPRAESPPRTHRAQASGREPPSPWPSDDRALARSRTPSHRGWSRSRGLTSRARPETGPG